MKDRACASCGLAFVAKAEGQLACTFKCAKHMQARNEALDTAQRHATRQARIDLLAGKKPS